jgi:glycerate 2-kinase
LHDVIRAALEGVSAIRVIARAWESPDVRARLELAPLHVIAAGKAAPAMATAMMGRPLLRVRSALAIGTHPFVGMPAMLDFMPGNHPFPDRESREAAREALRRARLVPPDEHLVLLISGGASALMAEAAEGLAFEDKQAATRAFMLAGADIHQLNALRKHLSRVKGGWLAAACAGATSRRRDSPDPSR